MSETIALLLQKHYIEYCKDKIGDSWQDCRLAYFEYETLEELGRIFLDIRSQYDAFLTSGVLPMKVIRNVDQPPYAVTGFFGGYLENTYRILLTEVLKQESVDSRRIGIDYVEAGTDLCSLLEEDRLPVLVREFEKKVSEFSTEELNRLETGIVEKYRRQYRAGKLDFIVTNFYSVVRSLKDEPVECYYSYPSRQALKESLELCVKNIRLEKNRKNRSAVIRISPTNAFWSGANSAGKEMGMLSLKSALLEYCKMYRAEPVFKDEFGDVELYLNLEQVQNMTSGGQSFELPIWLKKRVQFDGFISLGTGEDLNRARFRALQARDYEQKMGQEASIWIDEQDMVRALPVKEKKSEDAGGISSDYVEHIANEAHLSSETVFRVIAAMQMAKTNELTANDLVRTQNFSLRVATRVLTALVGAGYGELSCQKRLGNKGRPQNLYHLSISY